MGRFAHTLRITDSSTPERRKRPSGTIGAEVRLKLVAAGTDPAIDPMSMTYQTMATDGTAEIEFPAEAAGQTAVYAVRWVGPRGLVGPWGPTAMGTVAA